MYSLSYHFQRVFIICRKYTLSEYIRKRRLTLVGTELANSKVKTIDVALNYCYESLDSFAKAFTKFHGITPSAARSLDARLCSFSRIFEIELKGGAVMNYSIKEMPEFVIRGYEKHFEGSPDARYGQQHDLWWRAVRDLSAIPCSAWQRTVRRNNA